MVQAFGPENDFAVHKRLKRTCRIPVYRILFDEIPDQCQIHIWVLEIKPIKRQLFIMQIVVFPHPFNQSADFFCSVNREADMIHHLIDRHP